MISNAYAQTAGQASGTDSFIGFLPIILMFVLLYFMMIRPQMKRAKEQRTMIEALQKGDECVTAGGVVGKVIKLDDNYVTLQVGGATEIAFQRNAITALLPKGSLKQI